MRGSFKHLFALVLAASISQDAFSVDTPWGDPGDLSMDSLVMASKTFTQDFDLMAVYYELADRLTENDSEKAVFYGFKAMNIARDRNDHKFMIKILNDLGRNYHALGKLDKAIEVYTERTDMIQEQLDENKSTSKYTSKLVTSYRNIGEVAVHQGDFQRAQQAYEQGIALAKTMKTNKKLLEISFDMMKHYTHVGNYREAQDILNTYLESFPEESLSARQNATAAKLAMNLDEYGAAQHYIDLAQNLTKDDPELESKARTTVVRAQLLLKKNQLERAKTLAEEALTLTEDVKHVYLETEALQTLIQIAIARNKPSEAANYANQLRSLLEGKYNYVLHPELFEQLANIYKSTGNVSEALKFSEMHGEAINRKFKNFAETEQLGNLLMADVKTHLDQTSKDDLSLEDKSSKSLPFNWWIPISGLLLLTTLFFGLRNNKGSKSQFVDAHKTLESKNNSEATIKELKAINSVLTSKVKESFSNISTFAGMANSAMLKGDQEKATEYFGYTQSNAKNSEKILGDISRLSEFTSREHITTQFSLEEIVSEVSEYLNRHYKPQFNFNINSEDLPEIKSSRNAIYLVLRNLLENGIVHSNKETRNVWVSYYSDDKVHEITIKDDGAGFKRSTFDSIFELEKDEQQTTPIGALGLSLCHKLMRKINGELILVESTPNAGSTFRLLFPIAK